MNTEKLTTKSRDAVTAAVRQALTAGNPSAEPVHLLHGLLLTPDNTVGHLLTAVGADPAAVDRLERLRAELADASERLTALNEPS